MKKFEKKLRKLHKKWDKQDREIYKFDWIGMILISALTIIFIIFIGIN